MKDWETAYEKLIPILKAKGMILAPLEAMKLGIQDKVEYPKSEYPDKIVPLFISKNDMGFDIKVSTESLMFAEFIELHIENRIKGLEKQLRIIPKT